MWLTDGPCRSKTKQRGLSLHREPSMLVYLTHQSVLAIVPQFWLCSKRWQSVSQWILTVCQQNTHRMVQRGSECMWANRETLWRRIRHTVALLHWYMHHRQREPSSLVAMTTCSCCSCIQHIIQQITTWCNDTHILCFNDHFFQVNLG